ncbi:hypothetical protein CBFG_04433 [Clostridiales bacterium 1_7_47FAA]|nr:hypothetical protein CBFG_04433 [Clostridiales bacterium 1_7_47FAA]
MPRGGAARHIISQLKRKYDCLLKGAPVFSIMVLEAAFFCVFVRDFPERYG